MSKKIKILSLDGGTHGFTWLFCLREIEESNPGFLAQTDVFAGSSFGGFCSLYFARHLDATGPGRSAVDIIEGCIAFMQELLAFRPEPGIANRLLEGIEAMYSHERMAQVLTDPKHLGDARLGDLQRRVIISTFGTKNPSWTSKVYDSAARGDRAVLASEVGLESAALPLMLPIRNRLTNGSLGGANSSLHGLTRVLGSDRRLSLNDIVVLALGGDPGTSTLANFPTPWDGGSAVPPQFSIESIVKPSPEDARAMALLNQKIDLLWKELEANEKRQEDPVHTKSRYGFKLITPQQAALTSEQSSTSWGWRHWLTYATSPLFIYQVIVNNQALETAEQTSLLLGDRTLRVAPMALLSSGQILFMTFLGGEPAQAIILRAAELTAELWADPETNQYFQFQPTIDQTESFLGAHWMPEGRGHRRAGRSGWRRGRAQWEHSHSHPHS